MAISRNVRIVIYALVVVIAILFILNFFTPNIDNARYMLSAIAQAEAAIIGIVITITFILVQLYSNLYSIRIFNLILKDKLTWAVISVFFIAIFFSAFSIAFLKNDSSLSIFLSVAVILFLTCFFAIAEFLNHVPVMINPKKIFDKLQNKTNKNQIKVVRKITRQEKNDFVFNELDVETEFSPFLDVIKEMANKGNTDAAVYGIRHLVKAYSNVIDNTKKYNLRVLVKRKPEEEARGFRYEPERTFHKLILQDFTRHVLDLWNYFIRQKNTRLINSVIDATKDVYSHSKSSAETSMLLLDDIFYNKFYNDLKFSKLPHNIDYVANSLIPLGQKFIELKSEQSLGTTVYLIDKICSDSKNRPESYSLHVNFLKFLATAAASSSHDLYQIANLTDILKVMTEICNQNKFWDEHYSSLRFINEDLEKVCTNLVDNNDYKYFDEVLQNALFNVADTALRRLDNITFEKYLDSITNVALYAKKTKKEEFLRKIFVFLFKLGYTSCRNRGLNLDTIIEHLDLIVGKSKIYSELMQVEFNNFTKIMTDYYVMRYEGGTKDESYYDDFSNFLVQDILNHKHYGAASRKYFFSLTAKDFLFISSKKSAKKRFNEFRTKVEKGLRDLEVVGKL